MMRRTALLLLLSSHAWGFAQVVLCTPAAHDTADCGDMAAAAWTIESATSCDDCGPSDCPDMSTCVAPVPALASTIDMTWRIASLVGERVSPIRTPHSVLRSPLRPPPRV